jgi:hypothetical protein
VPKNLLRRIKFLKPFKMAIMKKQPDSPYADVARGNYEKLLFEEFVEKKYGF